MSSILPPEFLKIRNSKHLEFIVKKNIDDKSVAHYLIVNSWDDVSKWFLDNLPIPSIQLGSSINLYVVDIFDVPNAMDTFRYCVKSNKETISTTALAFSSQLPNLVVIHKTFPRMVENNGAIAAELRID
tara:strand:+ start:6438 stop:6824 length:387 start_codon:yes stop_codon:yes gene_type:complete